MNIKTKLPLYYSVIGLICIVGFGFALLKGSSAVEEGIRTQFSENTQNVSNRIETFIYERLKTLEVISEDSEIQRTLVSRSEPAPQAPYEISKGLQGTLEHFLLTNGAFHTIDVLDINGKVVGSIKAVEKDDTGKIYLLRDSIGKYIGTDRSDEPVFKEVKQTGKYLAQEDFRVNDREMDIVFSIPVFMRNEHDEKRFMGVMVAKMDMIHIRKIIGTVTDLDTDEQITLYNRSGTIIASPDKTKLFSKLQKDLPSFGLLNLGRAGIEIGKDTEGVEKIFSFAPLHGFKTYAGLGWGVEISQPIDEAFQKIELLRFSIIGSILFVILSVFFLIAVIWKQFTIPLSYLLKNVRKMSDGDYDVEMNIKTHDEV